MSIVSLVIPVPLTSSCRALGLAADYVDRGGTVLEVGLRRRGRREPPLDVSQPCHRDEEQQHEDGDEGDREACPQRSLAGRKRGRQAAADRRLDDAQGDDRRAGAENRDQHEAGGHRADDASGSVGCIDEPDSAARLGGAVDEEPDRQRERIAEQTRDRKDEGHHHWQAGWALDVADDQRHEREARRAGQARAKRRHLGRAVLLALVNQAAAGDPDQEDRHDRDEDVDG